MRAATRLCAFTITLALAGCSGEVEEAPDEPVVGDQDGDVGDDTAGEPTGDDTAGEPTGDDTAMNEATTPTPSEEDQQQDQGDGGGSDVVEVIETSYDLSSPRVGSEDEALTLTLPPGTYTFRAVNQADIVHALQVEGHGIEATSGNIQPGQSATFTVTLDQPGEYDLYCPVANHKQLGMDGAVQVQG